MELYNDDILASQYADTHRHRGEFEPERRLLAAAFESHLKDTQVYLAKGKVLANHTRERRRLDALEWVADDSEGSLTFRWYCAALGLDAGRVRKALREETVNLKRAPAVLADVMRDYHRRYRDKNRERLRKYNTAYCRERRVTA